MPVYDGSVIRVSTGYLNTVNDTYIGGAPAGSGAAAESQYPGQLGKSYELDDNTVALLTNTSVGTLYAGRYQYVRMRADDDDSPAISVGKILFWDTTLTNWQNYYQVTRDENLSSSDNAVMIAGIYIGGFTGGNYGFIFTGAGLCNIRFRAVLTTAGADGSRVYAAGSGDTGSDQGTADVLTTDSTSLANARYLGNAIAAPSGGSLTLVNMADFKNTLL